jgi:hypothetical protein
LRFELPNGNKPSYKIRLTSDTSLCWLTHRFVEMTNPNYAFIESIIATSEECDEEYYAILKEAFKDNPEMLQRYLDGSWQRSETQ